MKKTRLIILSLYESVTELSKSENEKKDIKKYIKDKDSVKFNISEEEREQVKVLENIILDCFEMSEEFNFDLKKIIRGKL